MSSFLKSLLLCLPLLVPQWCEAKSLDDDQRKQASTLFGAYRKAMEANDHEAAEAAIDQLKEDLPAKASEVVKEQIEKEITTQLEDYQAKANAILEKQNARSLLKNPEVVADRKLIRDIMAVKGDDEQKKRLAEEGWPAIQRLQKNLLPDTMEVLGTHSTLMKLREGIVFRLDLCDELAEAIFVEPNESLREKLENIEKPGAGLIAIVSRAEQRLLEKNEKVAVAQDVPEVEVEGVRDANRLRILAGLSALELDPKLCLASRIHSEDMSEHGFFDHESPVAGRKTPWDRAKEAGTTASAENIAAGQSDGAGANHSWFHSPGHFRNMFGNHRRIGLGHFNKRWTQLLGN